MLPALPIILIGPMGAGKSTIGRLLSEQLQLEFVDLDREIEVLAGATIPWIFDIEGEAGFRKRETSALEVTLERSAMVLATGGGCVLTQVNHGLLSANGVVIYLKTSVAQQLQRTAKDKNRPLLQSTDPEAVLIEMAKIRNPLYEQLADVSIDTDAKIPRTVVFEIQHYLQQFSQ